MMIMKSTHRGFTLIEMLVVMGLLSIIMIGLLNLLDTSSQISVVETSLSDTQENVRFAAYHIMRTSRMMGSSVMPFAANIGGADRWLAGELASNVSGGTATTPFGSVGAIEGSDVLTLRGFFEIAPFFTDRTDLGSGTITIRESDAGEVINENFDLVDVNGLEGRGLFFMGRMDQGEYAVGQIDKKSSMDGTAPNRTLTIDFMAGAAQWSNLNPAGISVTPVPFDVYRVGVLESYTYYVDPDFTLQRMRANSSAGGASSEPVAINIGSLQVGLGIDSNNDNQVDLWAPGPTAAQVAGNRVIGMRITVLGRTDRMVPGWTEPAATFAVEDMDANDVDRTAKWRTIEVAAALRNYLF
jgi:prepilin-type N-terminal cleavage/methylation domain-containing protein